MSLAFPGEIPDDFKMQANRSTAKAIVRKNLMEILPVEQTTYAPDGNDIIRFNIGSNTDFLLGKESYFRFNVQRDEGSGYDNLASLDVGGVHALFKNIEIRSLATGVLIQRYDAYNRYYAMKSLIHQSPQDIEYYGAPHGDSVSDLETMIPYASGKWAALTLTDVDNADVTGATLTLGGGGRARSELEVGDLVWLQGDGIKNGQTLLAAVSSITTDEIIVLDQTINIDIVAGELDTVRYLKRNEMMPARVRAVQTSGTDYIVTMRPFLSVLDQNLPLFLMKGGIEISFELENANRCIKSGLDLEDSTTAISYAVSQARCFAMMATPHQEVVDEYVAKWDSPEGLVYHIPSVRTRRYTGAAAAQNESLQMNFGVRSARKVYTVCQDSAISEGTAALARSQNSISKYLRSLITQFQFKVGSHEFPNRQVVCNVYSSEALEQLKNVAGHNGKFRFHPKQWYSVNSIKIDATTVVNNESEHFIVAADLSRDNGPNSLLTGTDLSIVPLDLDLERSGAYSSTNLSGNPIYFTFVEHDAFLKIASNQ